jgi:hypothetical protein
MGYYDNILNLLSLVLVLAILFIILFGCQFKKYRKIERFTDKNFKKEELIEDDEEEEKPKEVEPSKKKDVKKEEETSKNKDEDTFNNKIDTLEGFEGQILSGLTSGSITSNDMDKFINAGTFTRENLENIISYVEKFKNNFS